MKKILLALVMVFFAANQVPAMTTPNLPAEVALHKLKDGNDRFLDMKMKHPNLEKSRRDKLINGQHPFAVVLTCSDSRVPPELIFDQGLGDIFVIRNAGNVLDEHVMGSIEYAVEHLGVNLVVVMGHESCGAVGAAMKEEKASPAIESLKTAIQPAVEDCKKQNAYSYENVIKTHAIMDVKAIEENEEIINYSKKRDIKIIPAYYSIGSGKVYFLK